ncbi:hypothetical protein MMC31_004158 [Peltigera leucophlebia]|nr:hypothetical protein [Peltigera leucophlebia]
MVRGTQTSTPDLSATLQVPSSFTAEQIAQILRATLAERDAIAAKSKLKLGCIQKESDARIAAATVPVVKPRTSTVEDDEIIGEIPPEVSDLSLWFAGLSQEEIVRNFHKFKPINLYRLRHMRGLRYKTFQSEERIGIEKGMLRLRGTSGSYKDLGNGVYETSHNLHAGLTHFYDSILQLAKAYDWKEALLPLAIEIHFHIVAQQSTDANKWVISAEFQRRVCTPMSMIKRSRSPPSRRVGKYSSAASSNNSSVTCELFNKSVSYHEATTEHRQALNIAQKKVLVGHIQRLVTRGTPPMPLAVRNFAEEIPGSLPRKELDYAIYTTSLSTFEHVGPAQYRQSTKESRVCSLGPAQIQIFLS